MSSSYYLPLKAPTPLPATGVTSVTFKVWKNTLTAHLEQDAAHHFFMSDGLYSIWIARDAGKRIPEIIEEDPDKKVLFEKKTAGTLSEQAYNAAMAQLLSKRNAQLAKFITHTANLCYYTEHDDITMQSTSLQSIFDYLINHYGLDTKGANFLKIATHFYKKGDPPQTFYKQYRAAYIDNLRKKNDTVKYKANHVLAVDEQLSPSFENAIVMWALEKIDPRLPAKVKKNYGHQMTGDTTLKDLQPIIFQNISSMLEELDSEGSRSNSLTTQQEALLNAMKNQNFRGRGNGRGSRPFRGQRGYSRGGGQLRSKPKSSGVKFCRICNLAGSEERVFTSHEIGDCSRLTVRDMESLRDSLVLNGMITEECVNCLQCVVAAGQTTESEYFMHPGWDDDEAAQNAEEPPQ